MTSDLSSIRQRGGPPLKAYRHQSVKAALHRLFRGKCAYCESRLGASHAGDIDQYRPKSGVLTADGRLLELHYWWLANDWNNLYLACSECNRIARREVGGEFTKSGKGGRFPLEDEAQRAQLMQAPDHERPLLLDPCRDDVESHLLFSADGLVSSTTLRGLTTIEILGLNRSGLVLARRGAASAAIGRLQSIIDRPEFDGPPRVDDLTLSELRSMMEPEAEYAGMCRQIIWGHIGNAPHVAALFDQAARGGATKSKAEERRARQAMIDFLRQQENYSLEDAPNDLGAYVSAADRRIQRIQVQNLRAIAHLDIQLTEHGALAPWLMLLGENASGKSTVLQAVALTLIGDKYRNQLILDVGLDLGQMVRDGAPYGEILVTLSSGTEPRVLRIFPDGHVVATGRAAQIMVLGYGSTRLLPRQGRAAHYGEPYARIENLFDPFIPLVDAETWLLSAGNEAFDYAAIAIKQALNVPTARRLVRSDGIVGLLEGKRLVPLSRLCDGYQTVIALIADILAIVLRAWAKPELAQGLVLIDEVGNHLHPSWKIRFVESMRRILPGIQFIGTTHEPLCLRGLRNGEVAVLRRGPRGGVQLIDELPPIEGMRIDQILTSEHFGLQSTLDPSLQDLFDRYYNLLRIEQPTSAQATQIAGLRQQIDAVQQLGNSERERRLLEAIDTFMAQRSDAIGSAQRSEREIRLQHELAEIWKASAVGLQ